jgi:Component of IIS longevity pathway SMK-1.
LEKIEIYESLLLSDNFLAVFLVLEYDKDISFKQDFYNYFKDQAVFNNFLAISDKKFLDKIHLAHRVLCLKESLMSKSFKEGTIQVL